MEDESYTYFFNSKDLCLIDYIPDLIDSGIDSLKIEGRMKSAYYVGGVVRIYREAIDSYCRKMNTSRFKEKWKEELLKVSNRGYTNGFFHERPGPEAQSYKEPPYQREYDFVGITRGKKEEGTGTKVEVRKKIERGDVLEILYKGSDVKVIETNGMRDLDGNLVESANPNSTVIIEEAIDVIPGQLIRRKGWRE